MHLGTKNDQDRVSRYYPALAIHESNGSVFEKINKKVTVQCLRKSSLLYNMNMKIFIAIQFYTNSSVFEKIFIVIQLCHPKKNTIECYKLKYIRGGIIKTVRYT